MIDQAATDPVTNMALLGALGIMLTVNGFLIKYVFNSHNKKIDELRSNCEKVATRVQSNVDELESKVDRQIATLDGDIKNVGEKLREQIQGLTSQLFDKIDSNRKETSQGLAAINQRLDNLINNKSN